MNFNTYFSDPPDCSLCVGLWIDGRPIRLHSRITTKTRPQGIFMIDGSSRTEIIEDHSYMEVKGEGTKFPIFG